jgi:pimeloyl-ACP methyl ester carboxylesterase
VNGELLMSRRGNGVYPELGREEVEALDIRTSYYTAGDRGKPAVILLHGMSTSADSFRELMHLLADDYWLIAPDIPGFGYSENTDPYTINHLVEWLAALIDRLALSQVHLLGHSFGGVLATGHALSYPEIVNRLVLMAPALLVAGNYPVWLRRAGKSFRLVEAGMVLSRPLLEYKIRAPFHKPAELPDTIWERRRADYGNARASAAAMNAVAFYDVQPRLGQVHQPTMIIWGEEDKVVSPVDAETLKAQMPQAQVYKVASCGHVPMLEQQQEVADITRGFLQ